MATFDVPMLEAGLEAIRLLSSKEVQDLAVQVLPLDQLPLAICINWAMMTGLLPIEHLVWHGQSLVGLKYLENYSSALA